MATRPIVEPSVPTERLGRDLQLTWSCGLPLRTACLKERGRVKGALAGGLGLLGVAGWVRARAGERVGVKVERPQRSEDERP